MKSRHKFEGKDTKEGTVKSESFFIRSGKRHASNICLVTFIIEIGFADPFDSQIFSMNAKLSEEKMITQGLRRIEGHGWRAGRIERGMQSGAECSYFVLITKTLSGKGGTRTRSKEEKLVQRENPALRYERIALTEDLLYLY